MSQAGRPDGPGGRGLPAMPPGFRFGVATSAFQIEGGVDERGPSIWDTFAAEPGRIRDGATGEPACEIGRAHV